MKLSALKLDRECQIIFIDDKIKQFIRSQEFGINNGTHLRIKFKTPFGDILIIEIDSYLLAVRNEMAKLIEVDEIW